MNVDWRGLSALLAALALLSGCILGETPDEGAKVVDSDDEFIKQYVQEQMKVNENASKAAATSTTVKKPGKQTTSTTSTTVNAGEPCPYECCTGGEYQARNCSRWFACVNHTCIDIPCPYECCVLGMHAQKECPGGTECVNYSCARGECPAEYECCTEEYYKTRGCGAGYACINHTCYSKDSDGDGLADVVESNYGTNANKRDSDGDGLSDYSEVKVYGTDPLDDNTDGDRYVDGRDGNPTVTDSAVINVTVYDAEATVNYTVIHALIMYLDFNQTKPPSKSGVAEIESNVRISNTGTDYTNYVNYTYSIGYWCPPGVDVRRKPFVIDQYDEDALANITNTTNIRYIAARGTMANNTNATTWTLKELPMNETIRLKPGDRYIRHHTYTLTFGDLTNDTWEAVASTVRCSYNVSVRNVKYESY